MCISMAAPRFVRRATATGKPGEGLGANMASMDVAVVGAGVVGCAIASALARRGLSVVVLERAPREGTGITSRNSGVIHGGLYYPPGSLKAEACLRGQALLYAWAVSHDVPHARTGKLVVARDPAEETELAALHANAVAAGARGLRWLGSAEVAAREPALPPMRAALWSGHSGIIDPHALTRSLRVDAERCGAIFAMQGELLAVSSGAAGLRLDTARGELAVGALVNAAGLDADHVAALAGHPAPPQIFPCRGDYFRLHTPGRYRGLIYPVRARG
ncbi:MAG: FAD-dependent oxidoreductase, partial [Gordonia sp. (in: high G+C Gram-positive bacteria)]